VPLSSANSEATLARERSVVSSSSAWKGRGNAARTEQELRAVAKAGVPGISAIRPATRASSAARRELGELVAAADYPETCKFAVAELSRLPSFAGLPGR
jgi:hypothetical protein